MHASSLDTARYGAQFTGVAHECLAALSPSAKNRWSE
jgi:hypothetical protein